MTCEHVSTVLSCTNCLIQPSHSRCELWVSLTPFYWTKPETWGCGEQRCSRYWGHRPVTSQLRLVCKASQSVWWPTIRFSTRHFSSRTTASAGYLYWDHPALTLPPAASVTELRDLSARVDLTSETIEKIRRFQICKKRIRETWPQYLNIKCLHLQRLKPEFFMMSKRCADYFEMICLKFWKDCPGNCPYSRLS